MDRSAYSVGALLYTPANNIDIAGHILHRDWPCLTSVCLCLEDSIQDSAVQQAERQLKHTLSSLHTNGTDLPMLFVRVKSPAHLAHVHALLEEEEELLTGYVFPKFGPENAREYMGTLTRINAGREQRLRAMPILESMAIARRSTRLDSLETLRGVVDDHHDDILNVRVGGNDFCNLFGLRRSAHQSIYDLGVVRDTLVDIVNMFSDAYVVSGPVWEYYGNTRTEAWEEGLRRELELDLANGFFGKTAIHPSQLPVIYESLKVSAEDLADAGQILNWQDDEKAVSASTSGGRMNELKCHGRWAERILMRAEIYGTLEES